MDEEKLPIARWAGTSRESQGDCRAINASGFRADLSSELIGLGVGGIDNHLGLYISVAIPVSIIKSHSGQGCPFPVLILIAAYQCLGEDVIYCKGAVGSGVKKNKKINKLQNTS